MGQRLVAAGQHAGIARTGRWHGPGNMPQAPEPRAVRIFPRSPPTSLTVKISEGGRDCGGSGKNHAVKSYRAPGNPYPHPVGNLCSWATQRTPTRPSGSPPRPSRPGRRKPSGRSAAVRPTGASWPGCFPSRSRTSSRSWTWAREPGPRPGRSCDLYPRSTAVLADYSAEMMRAGEREMQPFAGRYRYVEFDMSAGGEWPAAIPAALDAVVTSMCVHHLPDDRKQSLFAEIFDHLVPGGWYLNYDPVRAEDPARRGHLGPGERPRGSRGGGQAAEPDAAGPCALGQPRPLHNPARPAAGVPAGRRVRGHRRLLEAAGERHLRRPPPGRAVLACQAPSGRRSTARPRRCSARAAASSGPLRDPTGSARPWRRWTSAPRRPSWTRSPGCPPTRTSVTCPRSWPRSWARRARSSRRRYGWEVDPALIHHVPDVLKALELAITRFSRPGSPVILPTPAYMPFLSVPGFLGREIIQVKMRAERVGSPWTWTGSPMPSGPAATCSSSATRTTRWAGSSPGRR